MKLRLIILALLAAGALRGACSETTAAALETPILSLDVPAPLRLDAPVLPLSAPVDDLAVTVHEAGKEVRIDVDADVLFDFDKAEIRPDAASSLRKVADLIRAAKSRSARVEGHTDSKGGDAYNQRLSERRAAAVRGWLATKEGLIGIAFTTVGFGARHPVAPNTRPDGSDDPAGRQRNRRVAIVFARP